MGTNQTTNITKKLDIKEGNQAAMEYIESLPTFNKLCLAQSLLKEMYSLKERFEENKSKMIGELEQNCYKYYKNKLYSKEIYDFFESNNLETRNNYKLLNNSKIFNKYKNIYDFLFFLRNNNSIVIEIINKCEPDNYKNLSYFIVHFFYEDTTNCFFVQEELLLFIYLFLENKIMKLLPEKLNSSLIRKDNELFNKNTSNNFSYHLFYSLTKKPDVREYLCSSLFDIIKKLEENQLNLSPETSIIRKIIGLKKEENIEKEPLNPGVGKIEIEEESNLNPNDVQIILKDNKELKTVIKESNSNLKKEIGNDKIKIDPFFKEEDIEYMYICDKLNYYENIKEKSKKDYAMIEYLDILLNEITKDGEPVEIFSTIILKNKLKMLKFNETNNNYETFVNKIKSNYDEITSLISNLLIKIRENINIVPFSLKCIFKIIEELLNKKYQNIKKDAFNYQLLIIKARILFGCMIIPMINKPDGSGIFTDGIISKTTKNNLNIIAKILKVLVSGNLFLVDNAGYTIYNKFIIDSLPNIFDIVFEIDEDITLPSYINDLIKDAPENIDNLNRKVNYDYFGEKKEEKIQFQSICFSWKDLAILHSILFNNRDYFEKRCKNDEEKEMFTKVVWNGEDDLKEYLKNTEENNKKKIIDYYSTYKIFYQKDFENKINAIIKDNFEILFQGQVNDEALRFKKCLTEILAYVNYLHKEDFTYLIKRRENQILNKNGVINEYIKYRRKTFYEGIAFDTKKKIVQNVKNQNDLVLLRQSLKKIENRPISKLQIGDFLLKRRSSIYTGLDQIKMNELLDFKNDIFPQIASKAMAEIYYNPEKGNSQRIIFCISYIQEHLDDLPHKYIQNNYKQIFIDILKEPEILIKELQYNILNKFHAKIRNSEKLNLISSKDYYQIKNMERYSYTGHLFNKVILKGNLKINIINKKITSIYLDLNKNNQSIQNNIDTIQSFINEIPDFRKFENNKENIINLEKKLKLNELINNYFKEVNNIVKNEKMISKFSAEEFLLITYELENYVLFKLYEKLYPLTDTPEDEFFYKKCCRLNFVKPDNIIKNKKMINEKLLEISINYISDISSKKTPVDKIKNVIKAIDILKNSMTFNSGKTDLGLDDTLPFIIYIVLKSKQKNIFTNITYCNLYINPELSKKQFGNMLTQLGMIMDIIINMKYNELINVTEEQFGKD